MGNTSVRSDGEAFSKQLTNYMGYCIPYKPYTREIFGYPKDEGS